MQCTISAAVSNSCYAVEFDFPDLRLGNVTINFNVFKIQPYTPYIRDIFRLANTTAQTPSTWRR